MAHVRTTPLDFVFSDPRLAEIARMGAEIDAQGMAEGDPPADPPKDDPADPPKDDPADPPKDDDDVEKLKSESRKHEDRHKREKAAREKAETEKKAADDRLAAVLKAAGATGDEDPVEKLKATAEELRTTAAERDDEKSKRVAAERQNLALRAAYAAGAIVDDLFESVTFLRELDALGDENGEATEADVKKLVGDTLKAKPRLKAGNPPPPTPGEKPGEKKRADDVKAGPDRIRRAYGS